MADYGMRISKGGTSVKTGDDEDMVMTSKYALLKGNISGGGTQSVSSNIAGVTTVSVNHALGYIPIGEVRIYSSGYGFWWPTPFAAGGPGGYFYVTLRYTANYLYIDFDYWDAGGDPISVDYKYFVHIDKGNP